MPAPETGSLTAAIGFLTRLKVGRSATSDPERVVRGAPLFPLVGAALGAMVGVAAAGLAQALPPLLAGSLAVALELVLTGALHADGLADSADGLGGRDREDSLRIMRDHSLGAYGASALALGLLIKATALGALAEEGAVAAVVAAMALSRAVPLALAAALPYARAGEGTGRLLTSRTGGGAATAAAVLAIALAGCAVGTGAIGLVATVAAAAAAVGLVARRRLGGVTGDVMGAAIELASTLALVAAVVQRG